MNKHQIPIGGKLVWPSTPYRPSRASVTEFVGREPELRLVTAAWIAGNRVPAMAPLLVGEPGTGKNRLVYELARRTGKELYIVQGHEDLTAEDLACAVRFSDSENTKMDYVISPLVTAMLRGGICFVDEIGKIRPRALALLVSVLDERRYIDSSLLAERVHAHPGFRFIAATNTGEINGFPDFIRSRMRPVLQVGFPPRHELDRVITSQFPAMGPRIHELLDVFWVLWETRSKGGNPPSPRDAINLFALAASMSELDRKMCVASFDAADGGTPYPLESYSETLDLGTEHVERAFLELFGRNGA